MPKLMIHLDWNRFWGWGLQPHLKQVHILTITIWLVNFTYTRSSFFQVYHETLFVHSANFLYMLTYRDSFP